MSQYMVTQHTRPSGTIEYRVVPADSPDARPDATYFDPEQAGFHTRLLSSLPSGFAVNLRFNSGGNKWVITGNIPGDQTGHRAEWTEGRQVDADSPYTSPEELLLAGVARYMVAAHGRLAGQRREAELEARQNPPADESGSLMYVWYNPDDWGTCSGCGEEYGPHDMIQDTPQGIVCENCSR